MSDVSNGAICDICRDQWKDDVGCKCTQDKLKELQYSTPHALTKEQVEERIKWYGENFVLYRARWANELLDHDAALRQALAQQAQEVDIVSADLSEARHQIGLLQQRIDTHCMTEAELRQQVATMETNAADNGTLFRAVLNEKLTLAQEVVKYAEEAQGYLVKIEHLADQLAAMTTERDEACGELLVSLDDAPIGSLAGKLVTANRVLRSHLATLQATLAAREGEVNQLNNVLRQAGWGQGAIDSAAYTFDKMAEANRTLVKERDHARQDAARLREALYAIACKNEPFEREDMIDFAQRALKGA